MLKRNCGGNHKKRRSFWKKEMETVVKERKRLSKVAEINPTPKKQKTKEPTTKQPVKGGN